MYTLENDFLQFMINDQHPWWIQCIIDEADRGSVKFMREKSSILTLTMLQASADDRPKKLQFL